MVTIRGGGTAGRRLRVGQRPFCPACGGRLKWVKFIVGWLHVSQLDEQECPGRTGGMGIGVIEHPEWRREGRGQS